ncbi:MAG: exosortase/archaeosortase family protein [Candidatus Freyarchaeota archaeon]
MKSSHPRSAHSWTALGIKAAVIIFAVLIIYHQDLVIIGNEAIQSELMSHILAIPILFTYLIYRKRKMLKAVIPFKVPARKMHHAHEIIGAMLCLLAFLLYWHGSYTFHPLEYHMMSLPLFVAGLILILFNTQTLRVLVFPIAFLLFLIPPPIEIIYTLAANLSVISSEAAYIILKAIGLPVTLAAQYQTPIIILTRLDGASLTFAIDMACAGIYSLTGFTIFAVFSAYIVRGAAWKKFATFLAGFPLIYALNIIRIVIILLIGNQYGMDAAMQAFHLLGGWALIFLGTLILLALSEKILKIQLFTTRSMLSCNYCNQNSENKQHFCPACGRLLNPMNIKLSKRDITKIVIIMASVVFIINLQAPVFALTEGPAEVTIQTLGGEQTVTQILPEIPGYTTKFVYRDKKFEEIAKQDASLTYMYMPNDKTKTTILVTIEIARARSSLHPWEVCLITWQLHEGYQPKVTQLNLRDVPLLSNPPIFARYFAFQDKENNLTQVVLYWYETALFTTTSGLEQKHVKISLIAFAENPEDVSVVEDELLPIGKTVANYWQPIKTWSQIALIISQNGILLMMVTTITLATILTYQFVRNQMEKKSNLKAYNNLALEEEKLILQAAHQATKQDKPTVSTIASYYQKIAGKPIELNLLLEKLNQAEEAGLVKKDIVSREGEPTLVWKSRIPL